MKNYLFILFLLISFHLSAQTKGILTYSRILKDSVANSYTPQGFTGIWKQYFSGEKSIEIANPLTDADEKPLKMVGLNTYVQVSVKKSSRPAFILKDLSKNEIVHSESSNLAKVLTEDKVTHFNWKLSNDTAQIGDYLCKKATVNFRGRNYTAWYSEEIPLQNGPWKFHGLPGLIFKVASDDGLIEYELIHIELAAPFDLDLIRIPDSYNEFKKIDHPSYIKLWDQKQAEYDKLSRVQKTTTLQNGVTSSVTSSISLGTRIERY